MKSKGGLAVYIICLILLGIYFGVTGFSTIFSIKVAQMSAMGVIFLYALDEYFRD